MRWKNEIKQALMKSSINLLLNFLYLARIETINALTEKPLLSSTF